MKAVAAASLIVALAFAGCLVPSEEHPGGVDWWGSENPSLVPVGFAFDFVDGLIRFNITVQNVEAHTLPDEGNPINVRVRYEERHNIFDEADWQYGEDLPRWRWIHATAKLTRQSDAPSGVELFRGEAAGYRDRIGDGFDGTGPPAHLTDPNGAGDFAFEIPPGGNGTLVLFFPVNTTHGSGDDVQYHVDLVLGGEGLATLHWFSGCFNVDTERFYGYRADMPGCYYGNQFGRPSFWDQ